MYPITHSQVAFLSGGKNIHLDCFLPSSNGEPFPAVIALHGSGGGHASMSQPATTLASQGFAVYVLHYFDRTGTIYAEKQDLLRNFPLWMKTLWDAVSHVERQHQIDPERIGLLGFSLGAYLSLSNAGIDPRVRAVVEFFGGLPKEMKLFLRRLPPVLILHGEADPTVPVEKPTTFNKCWSAKALPTKCRFIVAPDTVSPVRPGATPACGHWHFSKNTSAILQEVSDKQVGGTSNCIHPYTILEELQEVSSCSLSSSGVFCS